MLKIDAPEDADLAWARDLLVLAQSNQAQQVAVDASAVARIGLHALQAVLVFARQAETGGVAFTITEPSPSFEEAVADLGLTPFLSNCMTNTIAGAQS